MTDRAPDPATETVLIPGRFNGPPTSANGGYTCGAAANLLDAPAAKVTSAARRRSTRR